MNSQAANVTPDLPKFREIAEDAKVIPVWVRFLADELTPVTLFRSLAAGRPGAFLFESAEPGKSWSRYSFVGVGAQAVLAADGRNANWLGQTPHGFKTSGGFLELLSQALAFLKTPATADLPPFTGGLVGYLGFDVIRHVEHLPKPEEFKSEVPDGVFWLVTDLAVLDHHDGHVTLIANAINYDGKDSGVDDAWASAVNRIEQMKARLKTSAPVPSTPPSATPQTPSSLGVTRVSEAGTYQASVVKAQEQISAGEAFQIVLSQRYELPRPPDSFDIYRSLRATNPSPYLYFLAVPDAANPDRVLFEIAGSSPEALVTLQNGQLTMHPIAGTRPRNADPTLDHQAELDLLADEKERSEHLMLVDLGRNDLSRVSEPGSVKVSQFMQVERYSHVMHLVSTIESTLSADADPVAAVLATFPAGTLSGAPKVRAIEIIDELEQVGRGVYGGAVGYFDFAGNADMAIAIRTAIALPKKVIVQSGAGVVIGSDPKKEDEECAAKAQVVIAAVQSAHRGLI